MNSKEIVSRGKMLRDLIAGYFFFGIFLFFPYRMIEGLFYMKLIYGHDIPNFILVSILEIALLIVVNLLCCLFSINSAFKKHTVTYNDAKYIARIIMIVLVVYVLCSVGHSITDSLNDIAEFNSQTETLSSVLEEEKLNNYKTQLYVSVRHTYYWRSYF